MKDRIYTITPPALKRRLLASVKPVGTEVIRIERSRGRVLAESIRASRAVPEMNRSAMDGYAVRHIDLRVASVDKPVRLESVANVPAGKSYRPALKPGTAARIMTGAPLPRGADSVVRIEVVDVEGEHVYFRKPVSRFKDVRRAGSEIRRNQIVLRRGQIIGPAQMAMLALFDQVRVKAYKRPRVAIISTGEELGQVGKKRPYGHIPDSNRYALLGLIESAGCDPINGGRVGDSPGELHAKLKAITRRAEFIITTGGVSAGDFDVVKVLFREVGGVRLYRLPMKPGKPQAFGHIGGVPFFGLPGNPVSCMVVFDFLVRPALRKMTGSINTELPRRQAVVTADFPPKSRQWEFPRAIAQEVDGRWTVEPVASQRSGDLTSICDAHGYVILGPDLKAATAGTEVQFVPLPQ